MSYPAVLTEQATIDHALAGGSLARYGDGEFKLCLGKDNISQRASPALAADLKRILTVRQAGLLVCIPNIHQNAKPESWANYAVPKYAGLLGPLSYGSAFVTRPDSAPWIDTPDYWANVRALWAGKHVTLVIGTDRSLRADMMADAASVRIVRDTVSHRDAYDRIDAIEAEIGLPDGPVILCLGACATVLAARLAAKGVQALDLGHIGMFMRHAGAYRYGLDELASHAYRAQLRAVHARGIALGKGWGGDGAKHLAPVLALADEIKAETVLDYGCGGASLCEAAKPFRRILNYDPGVEGRDGLPKPVDLVVCTDVLEHVEPAKLDNVLGHIHHLSGKAAYLVIATRKAKALLPDGSNAHKIIEGEDFWRAKLEAQGWLMRRCDVRPGQDITFDLRKAA